MGKFNSLTPDVLENIEPVYMEALDYAFDNKDIKNSRIICSPRREKRIPETPQSRINTMFLRLCSFLWLRYKNLF